MILRIFALLCALLATVAPTSPRRNYVTLAVAADRLSVSTLTIRRYIAAGKLTGYRVGPRSLRVDAEELEALVRVVPTTNTGS